MNNIRYAAEYKPSGAVAAFVKRAITVVRRVRSGA